MPLRKFFLALCAFFVAAVGLSACGSGISGDSVANVAGNSISTSAFNHWIYVAAKGNASQSPGAPVIVPNDPPDFKNCLAQVRKQIPTLAKTPNSTIKKDCNQLFTSLGSQVMDFLIKAYWYQALAAKHHIKLTDAQVQQDFNTARKQQFPTSAAFQTFLTQTGQTMQDILFRVRVNAIYKKLLALHVTTPTQAQIRQYWTTHTSQFGTPETRNLRIIRTNDAKSAAAARAALDSGQSWQVVAKKYSVDAATKNKGGQLIGVTKGQEEQALDNAAFSASVNKVIGPIHGTFGYYVIEVTKVSRGNQQSLAQATPLVKQILQTQQQQKAQSLVDSEAKKAYLHQTKCRGPYSMADCDGYKPPKTSSIAAPGTQAPQTQTATSSTATSTKK